jgi:hypothetical protein
MAFAEVLQLSNCIQVADVWMGLGNTLRAYGD